MKQITKDMIKIYNLKRYDFLGYTLEKDPTFHHIQKREHGGKYALDNGAILNHISHNYLHIIEYKDPRIFLALQQLLLVINRTKEEPTLEMLQIIDHLLLGFEQENKEAKNSKGKILIKPEHQLRYLHNNHIML